MARRRKLRTKNLHGAGAGKHNLSHQNNQGIRLGKHKIRKRRMMTMGNR